MQWVYLLCIYRQCLLPPWLPIYFDGAPTDLRQLWVHWMGPQSFICLQSEKMPELISVGFTLCLLYLTKTLPKFNLNLKTSHLAQDTYKKPLYFVHIYALRTGKINSERFANQCGRLTLRPLGCFPQSLLSWVCVYQRVREREALKRIFQVWSLIHALRHRKQTWTRTERERETRLRWKRERE